ncbi:MAG: cell division ATP-binding protein FtsE [Patescibacteria group bacterium]
MLKFNHVSKYYGTQPALKNVNITIGPGEFVSLIGFTGAGKTTFMQLITREVLPSKGSVTIDGIDTATLNEKGVLSLRKKVGIIFQDFKLLDKKTVYENIAFALEVSGDNSSSIKKKTLEILELVKLPQKVNSRVTELSGGEKQRVCIARALIHNPKLLLADEPTGNLDPIISWEIVKLLLEINSRGTTVIMATHNEQIVNELKRRVITLKNGSVHLDQEKNGKYVL